MGAPRDPAGVELAYERIRTAIVEGEYPPGQRLIEQKIAEQYDLSRTPVREAIRRLEAEGFVVSERNRGAAVRGVSLDEVLDLYELRARLESYAVELVAERIHPDELDGLWDAVERFGAAIASGRGSGESSSIEFVRQVNDANGAFHDAIVSAARHDRLAAMLRRTVDIPLVFRAFRLFHDEELQRSDLFHRLIVEAIAHGESRRAARLMSEHIAQGRDAVMAGLARPHTTS